MQEKREIAALRRWILDNKKDWFTICGITEERITEQEYRRLHNLLIENDFEEITLVSVIVVHIENRPKKRYN